MPDLAADPAIDPAVGAAAPFLTLISEPLPPSTFADVKSTLGVVPLQYPVAFGGRTWTEIHLRVFTTAQVAAVIRNYDRRLKVDPEAVLSFPVYVDGQGLDVPDGLMQQLAQDDIDVVSERASDFLPRRFRPSRTTAESASTETAPSASGLSSGAATGPSSAT